jgi:hypothetical protein
MVLLLLGTKKAPSRGKSDVPVAQVAPKSRIRAVGSMRRGRKVVCMPIFLASSHAKPRRRGVQRGLGTEKCGIQDKSFVCIQI